MYNLQLDKPVECQAYEVVDSALLSPHNSFINTNQHYLLTVCPPDKDVIREIEHCFEMNRHPDLPHENAWKFSSSAFTVNTLSMPRLPKGMDNEFNKGDLVWFACKPNLMIGDEAVIERMLLVAINNPPMWEDEAYWESIPAQEFNF